MNRNRSIERHDGGIVQRFWNEYSLWSSPKGEHAGQGGEGKGGERVWAAILQSAVA
jgi:hypothetical protein